MCNRITALCEFLGCSEDAIGTDPHDDKLFTSPGGHEYLVLTDGEADKMAKEEILSSVWAFTPEFLVGYVKAGISTKFIRLVQKELCEDANDGLKAMLNNEEFFVREAIQADGRGRFIARWDHEEHENNGYFIYQIQ